MRNPSVRQICCDAQRNSFTKMADMIDRHLRPDGRGSRPAAQKFRLLILCSALDNSVTVEDLSLCLYRGARAVDSDHISLPPVGAKPTTMPAWVDPVTVQTIT
jgi:hypothetical protein